MNKLIKAINLIRVICYKVANPLALQVSYRQRIWERHIRFSTEPNAQIKIGNYAWIRENAQFWCISDAKIQLGNNVFINTGCIISSRKSISIGDGTIFGPNVMVYDHNHDYKGHLGNFVADEIVIGKNVWIGANACILKGVTIGDNAVIGAGTVVTKDIPSGCVATNGNTLQIREVNIQK